LTGGTLFVVATPIGNLEDWSPRARQTLGEVDLIAAEDTRHTGRLLDHFAIQKKQVALHDHNEVSVVSGLIEILKCGKSVALVSDAGTPLISDPGFRLVRTAHESGITVKPIPGASAAIAALSVAGLPTDRFSFQGFLPARREARISRLYSLRCDTQTLLFFESVHRINDTLRDITEIFGAERQAFIGREMSKLHEQCVRAPLQQLCVMFASGEIVDRGEFVLAVDGASRREHSDAAVDASELLAELVQLLPGSQAVDLVAKLSGRKRNQLYKEMLNLKSD